MDAAILLQQLVAIPSVSRDESRKADFLQKVLQDEGFCPNRIGNNLWCPAWPLDNGKPTILLNSHIDTVKPSPAWTSDPFCPVVRDGKITALGANDAHASVVSLLSTFIKLSRTVQSYNLLLALSCEEEVSGAGGMETLVKVLPEVNFAIVGEPTGMKLAVAEKGLMVLDCVAQGVSGHAARNEGVNAIYKAVRDIEWFEKYEFAKVSPSLGKVKMSVTMIEAGRQHNVVPDSCRFTVDVRLTECYTHEEILETVRKNICAAATPRSMRLKPSAVPESHPFVLRYADIVGRGVFGSSTMSDQALMPYASVKIGPGDSARSHTADEYILVSEIEEAEELYYKLLDGFSLSSQVQ